MKTNNVNTTTISIDSKIEYNIFKSVDYKKFKHLASNRLGSFEDMNLYTKRLQNRFMSRFKKVKREIEMYGYDLVRPIIVGRLIQGKQTTMYILDGQCRKAVCEYLKIPFYYVVVERDFHSETEMDSYVLSLNTTQTSWTEEEKIASFIFNNNNRAQYTTLVEDIEKVSELFGISYAQSFRMLYSNSSINKVFVEEKMGKMKRINNADMLIELISFYKKSGVKFWKHNKFISALTSTVSSHDFTQETLGIMKSKVHLLYKCSQPSEYRVMFQEKFGIKYYI